MKRLIRKWLVKRRQRKEAALRERCIEYVIRAKNYPVHEAVMYEAYISKGILLKSDEIDVYIKNGGTLPEEKT